MKSSTTMKLRAAWRAYRQQATLALCAMIALMAVPMTRSADDEILLYPLPSAHYGPLLRVAGIASAHQSIRIEANGSVVAKTRANESGDFATTVALPAGVNDIRAVVDGNGKHPLSSAIHVVRQGASYARRSNAEAAGRASPAKSGGFAIMSVVAPTIATPAATTGANPITLSGTAPASSRVGFYVNGRFTREVVAATDGTFSTWVPLEDGLNSVYATATDATGTSPVSNTVQTTYTNSLPRSYGVTTISVPTVWTAGSAPTYTLTGDMTISAGATLWIQPGVTISMSGYRKILSQGNFVARGTTASRAVLRPATTSCTDTTRDRSDWAGVEVTSAGSISTEYADFYCGADSVYFNAGTGTINFSRFISNATAIWIKGGAIQPVIAGQNEFRKNTQGLYIGENGDPSVTGENLFTDNWYGILVVGGNTAATDPMPVVNGNSIYGNNNRNYATASFGDPDNTVLDARNNWWGTTDPSQISQKINDRSDGSSGAYVDFGGFLGAQGGAPAYTGPTLIGPVMQSATLPAADYLMLGDVVVNTGATWTLTPGTVIRAVAGMSIQVNGSLQASGTSTQRVHFTSAAAYPKKADWAGIVVGVGATANMNYARVEYGDKCIHYDRGQGSVTRSLIRFCVDGIYVGSGSNPTINLGNEISYNDYGIDIRSNNVLANNPLPVVNGNSLFSNALYNYYAVGFATPKPTLDATGNWWGTAIAANIPATIYTGSTTSPTVDYSGFLAAEPIPQAMRMTGVSMSVQQVKPLITMVPAAGTFAINRSGTVTYQVRRDSDNALVRQWTSPYAAPGTYAFNWDGLNDQGAPVAGGLYRIVMIASDGLDPYVYDVPMPAPIISSWSRPDASYNPYLNEFYKVQLDFSQSSLGSFVITPLNGTPFDLFRDVHYPAGNHWIYWDGRTPDGALLTSPSATFAVDETPMRTNGVYVFTPKVTVTGTGAAPNIEVKSDPYLITHSYDQSSQIVYRIDADAVVRVTLLPFGINDPNHPSAIVLVDNVAQSARDTGGNPIDHVAEWRGFDATDPNGVLVATDGAYTFAIEATLPANGQKTLYRGILNLTQ